MVTPFLFFSGYGVMISIEKKKNYLDTFMTNRVLKTLVHFDLAVLMFYVMNMMLGVSYDKNLLLVLIGWESIGNSNWYIFVLLCLYTITYGVFSVMKNRDRILQMSVFTVLSSLLILTLYFFKEDYWYNTIPAYVVGMWYCVYRNKINIFLQKYYYTILFVLLILCTGLSIISYNGSCLAYMANSIVFCLLLLTVTFKLEIGNKILSTLGNYVFEVYILQRLVYVSVGQLNLNTHLYFLISCLIIAVISYAFRLFTNKIDNLI